MDAQMEENKEEVYISLTAMMEYGPDPPIMCQDGLSHLSFRSDFPSFDVALSILPPASLPHDISQSPPSSCFLFSSCFHFSFPKPSFSFAISPFLSLLSAFKPWYLIHFMAWLVFAHVTKPYITTWWDFLCLLGDLFTSCLSPTCTLWLV